MGDRTGTRSLVQLLNYSKAAEVQVAGLQMAEPGAGRQHPANCRHCHVHCHSMADRVCGAHRCWQKQGRACVSCYGSGLMRDKTKPESIVIVAHDSSNATWNCARTCSWQTTWSFVFCFSWHRRGNSAMQNAAQINILMEMTVIWYRVVWLDAVCSAAAAVCGGQQGQTKTASSSANEKQSSHEASRDVARFRELNTEPTGGTSNYQQTCYGVFN